MAHWKKGFPSKYLQASDLDGGPLHGTIKEVRYADVGAGDDAERKQVAFFHEPQIKGVVLNMTRCEQLETIIGDPETDHWPGHRVKIVRGVTRYQGKRVFCIAFEAPDDIDEAMPTLASDTL
jgi:hypothetical protein